MKDTIEFQPASVPWLERALFSRSSRCSSLGPRGGERDIPPRVSFKLRDVAEKGPRAPPTSSGGQTLQLGRDY